MKTVEITEASLAEYGRKTAKETWVLTRRGKPVARAVSTSVRQFESAFTVATARC